MDERNKEKQDPEAPAEPRAKKKPYRKPQFLCERAFETMALACGKIGITQHQCHLNRRNS